MHIVEDLDGTTCARGVVSADSCRLVLQAASGFTAAGAYYPAESIAIEAIAGIVALRDFCDRMIEAHNELN